MRTRKKSLNSGISLMLISPNYLAFVFGELSFSLDIVNITWLLFFHSFQFSLYIPLFPSFPSGHTPQERNRHTQTKLHTPTRVPYASPTSLSLTLSPWSIHSVFTSSPSLQTPPYLDQTHPSIFHFLRDDLNCKTQQILIPSPIAPKKSIFSAFSICCHLYYSCL